MKWPVQMCVWWICTLHYFYKWKHRYNCLVQCSDITEHICSCYTILLLHQYIFLSIIHWFIQYLYYKIRIIWSNSHFQYASVFKALDMTICFFVIEPSEFFLHLRLVKLIKRIWNVFERMRSIRLKKKLFILQCLYEQISFGFDKTHFIVRLLQEYTGISKHFNWCEKQKQ